MLDHDALLSAFPAMAVQRLHQRGKGPAQPVRLIQALAPDRKGLVGVRRAPVGLHRSMVRRDKLSGRHILKHVTRLDPLHRGQTGAKPPAEMAPFVRFARVESARHSLHDLDCECRIPFATAGCADRRQPALALAVARGGRGRVGFAYRDRHRLSGFRPAEARAPPSYLCWLLRHACTKSSLVSVATASAAVCIASQCIVLRGAWTLNSSPHKRQVEGDCLLLCQPHKLN